jgi:hypothetical protein
MLLDAHKAPRPKRENARPLWDELWKARTVAEKSDSAILAAPNHATTLWGALTRSGLRGLHHVRRVGRPSC